MKPPILLPQSCRSCVMRLQKSKKKNKKALDRAFFLRPSLQNDDKSHLLFLRATIVDAVKAAGLMARQFEHKLSLFGGHCC
jgi:hypothetical protein